MYLGISLVIAFIIDCILGDPVYSFHPIILIGKLIDKLEKAFRKLIPNNEYLAGLLMSISVDLISLIIPVVILILAYIISPVLYYVLQVIFCYQILAARCLKDEAFKVKNALVNEGLDKARVQVGYIVGRDTNELSQEEVIKATVETVAENASDGVIAPMFYFLIGGAPLAFLYKAVNTQDSMVGYKNDKYINFGRFAAKVDDIFNYIPARISGLLFVLGAFLTGLDGKNSWKVFKRDRYNSPSPNSAQTESACAGALDVKLGGDAIYFGVLHKKPSQGDAIREISIDDIDKTCRLMYSASILFIVIGCIIRYFI